MKHLVQLILGTFATLTFSFTAFAVTYNLDEAHTNVSFKVKHLVISTVSGRFDKFKGSFDWDAKAGKLENVRVTVDANSVDTNEPDRDKHLRSPDFFDTAKFKTLEFVGKKVNYTGGKPTQVMGDLTIHGVTKPVTLEVTLNGEATDPWGNQKLGFDAKTRVDRKDYGLKWNKTLDKGGVAVADEVDIIIEGEANMVKPKDAKK
jgi:polyisoprenoid-binding protein YceI